MTSRFYDHVSFVMVDELGETLGGWKAKIDHLIEKHGADTAIARADPEGKVFELMREHRRRDDGNETKPDH